MSEIRRGEQLKQLRRALGWTQEALARRTGALERAFIGKVEAGFNQASSYRVIDALAGAVGVSPGLLNAYLAGEAALADVLTARAQGTVGPVVEGAGDGGGAPQPPGAERPSDGPPAVGATELDPGEARRTDQSAPYSAPTDAVASEIHEDTSYRVEALQARRVKRDPGSSVVKLRWPESAPAPVETLEEAIGRAFDPAVHTLRDLDVGRAALAALGNPEVLAFWSPVVAGCRLVLNEAAERRTAGEPVEAGHLLLMLLRRAGAFASRPLPAADPEARPARLPRPSGRRGAVTTGGGAEPPAGAPEPTKTGQVK